MLFPSIDVRGDLSFILPFNLDLQDNLLKYATAQPMTRVGNTCFFAQIEGIDAQYKFADNVAATYPDMAAEATTRMPGGQIFSFLYKNIRIVTVPWQQARFLHKLDGAVYIGKDCDLYLKDGDMKAVQNGSFAYLKWNGAILRSTAWRKPGKTRSTGWKRLRRRSAHGGQILRRRALALSGEPRLREKLRDCAV